MPSKHRAARSRRERVRPTTAEPDAGPRSPRKVVAVLAIAMLSLLGTLTLGMRAASAATSCDHLRTRHAEAACRAERLADGHRIPYVWGGTTTRGFDCSGLVQYVYRKSGVELPRTTFSQWADWRKEWIWRVSLGSRLTQSDLQYGDLVYYDNPTPFGHVGIYVGHGQVVHASTGSNDVRRARWNMMPVSGALHIAR